MKKNVFLLSITLLVAFSFSGYAQFTEGGSVKNYEKYRYKVNKRTITKSTNGLPQRRQSYFYFSVGVLAPLSAVFRADASPTSSISETYASENISDGMGGKTGGAFSFGGFYAFKRLNNKLTPLIDLGMGQNHTLSIHSYDWKNVNSFYRNDVSYRPFVSFASTIAPMVVINPLWKGKNKLHIDVGYKLGAAVIFGGGQYGTSSASYEITRSEFLAPRFVHGPSFRVRYSALLVGLDFSFLKENTTDAFDYYYSDGVNYINSTFDSGVNLSNFTFNVGVAF